MREWLAGMVDLVEAGETRAEDGQQRPHVSISRAQGGNPPRPPLSQPLRRGAPAPDRPHGVRLPTASRDRPYLDACPDNFRPLAQFLIGTGARISEALAVRVADVELDQGVVRIYRQRAATASGTAATKGKRFRSVQVGPALATTLRELSAGREGGAWLFVCPVPRRGRYAHRVSPTPPSRHGPRLARGGPAGRRAQGHAASRASSHGRCGVAHNRAPADLRAAPAGPPLDYDDRGALRTPRSVVPGQRCRGHRNGDRRRETRRSVTGAGRTARRSDSEGGLSA